jgi:hypothetical protein
MKTTSKIIAAAAVALFAAAGAQAETYEGVLQITDSTVSRAEVQAGAVQAAKAGNLYADGAFGADEPFVSTASRSAVRAEAVAAAHDPLQNLDRKAFVNSEVPAQYKRAADIRQQAAL